MAYKMKGAPMHDLSSKHGTNANYKKSGAPGLLGKILDPLGLKNKLMGKGKGGACPPAGQQAAAAPAPNAPAQPAAAAPVAAAAAAPEEAAAPTMMKKGLKNGALMKKSPMEKGKTTTVDKVKSAGKAIWDTLKQEWRDPAGHGSNDSTSHRVAGHYSKRKKQARREMEIETTKNKNKKK